MKRFEVRDIKMVTGKKKGDSVTFDILMATRLKTMLDHHRGDFIDIGLAIYQELQYACTHFGVKLPYFKGDALMKTRDIWSDELKKRPSLKSTTKKLRREVARSIHTRNKYAHGKLSFLNNGPIFTHDDENRVEVSEPFSEQVILSDKEQMISTLDELRKLNITVSKMD